MTARPRFYTADVHGYLSERAHASQRGRKLEVQHVTAMVIDRVFDHRVVCSFRSEDESRLIGRVAAVAEAKRRAAEECARRNASAAPVVAAGPMRP